MMFVLTLLIVGSILVPEAYTLECYQCTTSGQTGTCPTTKQCPSSSQCGAIKVVTYAGGSNSALDMKDCAPADQCISGSVNFGATRTVFTTKCCSTDLCNKESAPEPLRGNPNGKKCFTCGTQGCTTTVNCEGDEDRCFTSALRTEIHNMVMKGCASKSVCTDTSAALLEGTTGAEISCCEGNLCNGATSITVSLLLLLLPLLSSVLF